jgi:hypothetical protein
MSDTVTCTSGNVYDWRMPPRHLHWKHGRIADHYRRKVLELNADDGLRRQILESMTPEERKEAEQKNNVEKFYQFMESMTDDERGRLEAYASDLVKAGTGRSDISDMPDPDLWELFALARGVAIPDATVDTDEGEVDAAVIESFRSESGVPPVLADVQDVREDAVEAHGAA